jgi:RNA polymerase sigma factor (TIGR02999 family)
MPPERDDVRAVLTRITLGEPGAADELLPLVYEQMHAMAAGLMRGERSGHTLQATALVHEAYLKLAGYQEEGWAGRAHFLAVAARAMRQILANHAVARRAQKRGGGLARVTLDSSVAPSGASEEIDALELDEALRELETLDERHARVVELRFFGGLTIEETAEVLGVSPRTVQLDWKMARLWLMRRLGGATDGP